MLKPRVSGSAFTLNCINLSNPYELSISLSPTSSPHRVTMVGRCLINHLLFIFVLSFLTAHIAAVPIKAVNLGGWLVTEGWIKPSLFEGIPNNDLLDGTQLQIKSVTTGKYLSAENGGGTTVVANRVSASGWETFKLWRITEKTFKFRVFSGQFVGQDDTNVVAVTTDSEAAGTFEIVRNEGDSNRIRIKSPNGNYLQAKNETSVTADFPESTSWGDDDPSVFLMSVNTIFRGEFQVTNGYGKANATAVMQEHWSTFITEDDFDFMSHNKLDAVRIPVGWWIAMDPSPPLPFVGGSLQALDNAFAWAQQYGMKVIIDLHAAPGSQNGDEHSATRDGSQEWGDDKVNQTVAVIDFLVQRYAGNPSLLAVELINEPRAPGVSLATLINYYQAGYNAVRKYTNDAYVIMSNRLSGTPTEFLGFAGGLSLTVVDVHYYNLFNDNLFKGMTVQQNIDYVNNNRTADINNLTTSNGVPLIFVGEWVAEWEVNGASEEDYQNYAKAGLSVYGQATFGWAYWTLKNVDNHWSLEWMIKNGYITL